MSDGRSNGGQSFRSNVVARFCRADLAVVALLVLVSLLVHPISYVLSHPFWYDETWVAVGRYSPLAYAPAVHYSSPSGWAMILRLPWPGEHGMRLLTLGFSAAMAGVAYFFGRDLGWKSRRAGMMAGALAGLAVALSPWALIRNELKPYTADAFFALLLLWMGGRVRGDQERQRLRWLVVVAACTSVISWASMFVSVGVFGGLFVMALLRRESAWARTVFAHGAVVAAVFGAVYLTLLRPFQWVLQDHWADHFLHGGPLKVIQITWWRVNELMEFYPNGAVYVVLGLFGWGFWRLVRAKPEMAIAVGLLGLLMAVLGRMSAYPYLDLRTSHFLLVVFIAVAALGAASLAVALLERWQTAGIAMAIGFAALVVWAGAPYFNNLSLPDHDTRSQVRYLEESRRDGDVIVVSHLARYGFGYYWRGGSLEFNNTVHFTPRVVGDGIILYELGDVLASLKEAIEIAGGDGATGRVWVVRTFRSQLASDWIEGYAGVGVEPSSIDVGPEPLEYFDVER